MFLVVNKYIMKKLFFLLFIPIICCISCHRNCVTKAPNKEGSQSIQDLFSTKIDDKKVMSFDISVHVVYNHTKPSMSAVSNDLERSVNEANGFSSQMYFNVVSSRLVKHSAILSDIRHSKKKESNLCESEDIKNTINLYIVRSNNDLEGYAPVLASNFEEYANLPDMNRVFVSYKGLADGAVLVHELGHFFGLGHVDDCRNYMSYNCYRDTFTGEQLETILRFARVYRSYLHRPV